MKVFRRVILTIDFVKFDVHMKALSSKFFSENKLAAAH